MHSSGFFLNTIKDRITQHGYRDVKPWEFHHSLPFYEQTPLHSLPDLASEFGVQRVVVKDESKRFGLRSFKPLGAGYALYHLAEQIREQGKEIVAATAGNHGVGVAFFGRYFELPTTIYIPNYVSSDREDYLKSLGAKVVRTSFGYDETVELVKKCDPSKYQILADTAWENYEQIPALIREGYYILFYELVKQLKELESTDILVLLQGGVGTFAAAGVRFLLNLNENFQKVRLGIVEPEQAACLFESAKHGQYKTVEVGPTAAGCLACGEPNTIEWDSITSQAHCFMKISDKEAERGIEMLYKKGIPTSHTGAITLAAGMCGIELLKDKLGVSESTTVVCINTEG